MIVLSKDSTDLQSLRLCEQNSHGELKSDRLKFFVTVIWIALEFFLQNEICRHLSQSPLAPVPKKSNNNTHGCICKMNHAGANSFRKSDASNKNI